MNESPRFHTLSGRFNGTTPLTTPWLPALGASAGRMYATQSTVGRISARALLRGGVTFMLVMARKLGDAEVTLDVRSQSSAENDQKRTPDDPAPTVSDALLGSIALTSAWSVPMFLGPTDALCPTSDVNTTMELACFENADAGVASMLQWFAAANFDDKSDCCASTSVAVDEAQTLEPWTNKRYFFVTAPAGSEIRYPALADVELDTPAVFVRIGDGPVYLRPQNAESQNGRVDGQLSLDGFSAVTVHRREVTWTASAPVRGTPQVLTNAAAGATVDISPPTGSTEVSLAFTAPGFARLPALASAGVANDGFVVVNTGTALAILMAGAGERLNGVVGIAEGRVWLAPGQAARVKKASSLSFPGPFSAASWAVVADGGRRGAKVLTYDVDATIAPWGAGRLIVHATKVLAQTLTLPSSADALLCEGAPLLLRAAGAGGLTVNGNGNLIAPGGGAAPATTLVLTQHDTAALYFSDATNGWLAVVGA